MSMAKLTDLFHNWRHSLEGQYEALLPETREDDRPAVSPHAVTIICLRLKYQLEQVIPVELPEERITLVHSTVITDAVVKTARDAGKEHKECVVFALLIVKSWFKKQAKIELWDADLHNLRATAAEIIAKKIIESEEDTEYLMREVLSKRYSILIDGEPSSTANAMETAVDLQAVKVIGSSGFQRTINWVWNGWLLPSHGDPDQFIEYSKKTVQNYWAHFDAGRLRVPVYQNTVAIIFSIAYLVLFSIAINTINQDGSFDGVEVLLYLFTLGFLTDELNKWVKVGRNYIAFWNLYHLTLYTILSISFVTRVISLQYEPYTNERNTWSELSYNLLATSAPFYWVRLILYFDTLPFFGTLLIVVQRMLKESLIFFALLSAVLIGFLQAFVGLDLNDESLTATSFIFKQLTNAILGSPDFGDDWDRFAPPWGLVLYYIYSLVVIVILLNVLIALFGSAYAQVTDDSVEQYLALFAHKTVQSVRAPDENVYIAPLNLIEIFLVAPLEPFITKKHYKTYNTYVMTVIYSPMLLVTAWLESRGAKQVIYNRRHDEADDDTVEVWEQLLGDLHAEESGWAEQVRETAPNVADDATLLEVRSLKKEIEELKDLLKRAIPQSQHADGNGSSQESAGDGVRKADDTAKPTGDDVKS